MENFKNLEIIQIKTSEDGSSQTALISFQDIDKIGDINNGYNTIRIPINLREIQLSSHGNMLVDQSVKSPDSNVCVG